MLISLSWFYMIHITFSHNFPLPYSYIYTLCFGVSVAFSPLLHCVWVQVMFERGSTRKPKREGRNLTQQFIAALHPLCALCYYFLEYQPNYTHQADDALGNHQFRDLFEQSGPGRRHAFSRPTRAAGLWQKKGRTIAALAAGGRRKSQGCNPEQETCLSQQSKHRPSSAHSND